MVVLDHFWLEFSVEFSHFSRGAKAVGKEAVHTGMNIMSDVTTGNTPIKESATVLKNRAKSFNEKQRRNWTN